jgi:hypothetical protein
VSRVSLWRECMDRWCMSRHVGMLVLVLVLDRDNWVWPRQHRRTRFKNYVRAHS